MVPPSVMPSSPGGTVSALIGDGVSPFPLRLFGDSNVKLSQRRDNLFFFFFACRQHLGTPGIPWLVADPLQLLSLSGPDVVPTHTIQNDPIFYHQCCFFEVNSC